MNKKSLIKSVINRIFGKKSENERPRPLTDVERRMLDPDVFPEDREEGVKYVKITNPIFKNNPGLKMLTEDCFPEDFVDDEIYVDSREVGKDIEER